MKAIIIFLVLVTNVACTQTIITDSYEEHSWMLNTGINLPAMKFHLASGHDDLREANGYLELFSSFGVGVGMNYGKAKFTENAETGKILSERTEFSNFFGIQFGVLYSSKVNELEQGNANYFSVFSGPPGQYRGQYHRYPTPCSRFPH